jgi:hypothetical protein
MASQMEAFLRMQMAMCEGWATFVTRSSLACARAMSHQVEIFERPAHMRVRNVAPSGADWNDHYGKRQGDVDVEKV